MVLCRIAVSLLPLIFFARPVSAQQPSVRSETLLDTTSSWDGSPYVAYPSGQPELSVLRISIPPHTTLRWHLHAMPNAGYIESGEITLEKQADGKTRRFVAGQVVPEMVNVVHRGVTGDAPVTLIVFYAGAQKLPLSQ